MSEHYFRVEVHGPPDPDEHPWVMVKFAGDQWRLINVVAVPGWHWAEGEYWFPVDAPPSELAPEPEGVEVDGLLWRFNQDGRIEHGFKNAPHKWALLRMNDVMAEDAARVGRVAQALGLVDQPKVPKALVDEMQRWISDKFCDPNVRYATTNLLGRIEAGEFGAVEPSVEWVTDDEREPTDIADLPAFIEWDDGSWDVVKNTPNVPGYRWVSIEALLDAARLR